MRWSLQQQRPNNRPQEKKEIRVQARQTTPPRTRTLKKRRFGGNGGTLQRQKLHTVAVARQSDPTMAKPEICALLSHKDKHSRRHTKSTQDKTNPPNKSRFDPGTLTELGARLYPRFRPAISKTTRSTPPRSPCTRWSPFMPLTPLTTVPLCSFPYHPTHETLAFRPQMLFSTFRLHRTDFINYKKRTVFFSADELARNGCIRRRRSCERMAIIKTMPFPIDTKTAQPP